MKRDWFAIFTVLLAFVALFQALPAHAFPKPNAAFPVKHQKVIQATPVRTAPSGPAHPAHVESIMHTETDTSTKPAKSKTKIPPAKTGVQLQRYQLKARHQARALKRPEPITGVAVTGLAHHWVSPLPESGHNYLLDYYNP